MASYVLLGGHELEKHKKYESQYKLDDDIFWGLGIENEVYLEFDKKIVTSRTFFISNHKRERYSIDYYSNYKKEYQDYPFEVYFDNLINTKNNNMEVIKLSDNNEYTINLPLFLNSHSFEKTDIYQKDILLWGQISSDRVGKYVICRDGLIRLNLNPGIKAIIKAGLGRVYRKLKTS
jgi:hypothetical protein